MVEVKLLVFWIHALCEAKSKMMSCKSCTEGILTSSNSHRKRASSLQITHLFVGIDQDILALADEIPI